ncbi:hypothetical protein IAU60_000430 [Kwoniella sp. DSM 27419]
MTADMAEQDVFRRPTEDEIRSRWDELFSDPLVSLSRLRANGLSKSGLGEDGPDGGVVLRSLHWRFYHDLLPAPTSPDLFSPALATSRESYDALRRRYLIAPDGRWASDCTRPDDAIHPAPSAPSSSRSPIPSASSSTTAGRDDAGGDGWDPLSLSTSSPWKTWFAHVELRATIAQDVERTFPDMPYFTLPRVRKCLTTSLFLYAVLNPDVGYRQGMHELLACCFLVVDRDSLDSAATASHDLPEKGKRKAGEEVMRVTLDRRYVEHDAYGLFQAIMKGAKPFYEWRAEEGPARSRTASTSASRPQAPIITRCNNMHSSLIRRIDPQLWERLETEGVEAQIWAIRWIRLIFTRELPFHLAMRIWDGVFSEDPGLGILDFVCVAMLLLIRNELVEADYPTLLTNLLHYPAPSATYPFEPSLVLSQALFLRNNISPTAGVEVVLQNQDMLGVRASPPPPERPVESGHVMGRGRAGHGFARGGSGRGRGARAGVGAGMGGLAQGLFERAQAAGLDKAFMSTVADLRKNLPDTATAYSYLPNLPFSPSGTPNREFASYSSIPSTSTLPSRATGVVQPVPRPTIQSHPSMDSAASVQSLKEAELEIAELRLAMVGMGKAMTERMEVLRASGRHVSADGSEGRDDKIEEAWRGLDRIKQSLLDAAGRDTADIVQEWGWHEGLETTASRSGTPAQNVTTEHPASPIVHSSAPSSNSHQATPGSQLEGGRGGLEFEDSTPTMSSVPAFSASPKVSTPTTQPRISSLAPSGSALAPVVVPPVIATTQPASKSATPGSPSIRADTGAPLSGLPRTPSTAPASTLAFARLPMNTSPRLNMQDAGTGRQPEAKTRQAGDPLAGLGVGDIPERKAFPSSTNRRDNKGSEGLDPLGVGAR